MHPKSPLPATALVLLSITVVIALHPIPGSRGCSNGRIHLKLIPGGLAGGEDFGRVVPAHSPQSGSRSAVLVQLIIQLDYSWNSTTDCGRQSHSSRQMKPAYHANYWYNIADENTFTNYQSIQAEFDWIAKLLTTTVSSVLLNFTNNGSHFHSNCWAITLTPVQ